MLNLLNLPLIINFILKYRRLFIIGVQTILIPLSYMLSFALRFDFFIVPNQFENFIKTIPFLILLRLFFFYYFDLFSGWWRFVSTEDVIKITKAVVFSSVCFVASVVFLFNLTSFPRSVFIIDALIIFLSLCGIRLLIRLLREGTQTNKNYKVKKNVLIATTTRVSKGNCAPAFINKALNLGITKSTMIETMITIKKSTNIG